MIIVTKPTSLTDVVLSYASQPRFLHWQVDFEDDTDLDMAEDASRLPTLDQVFAKFPDTPGTLRLLNRTTVRVPSCMSRGGLVCIFRLRGSTLHNGCDLLLFYHARGLVNIDLKHENDVLVNKVSYHSAAHAMCRDLSALLWLDLM